MSGSFPIIIAWNSLKISSTLTAIGNQCRRQPHAKHYQDVQELLNDGIDVYTMVNVQHIESLNDTVASITGVLVRERIPNSIFESLFLWRSF